MFMESMDSGLRATLLAIRVPAFEAVIRKSVEPALARRPVIIASAFKPLGRVLAACPQARRAGVEEEMHFPLARERCPEAAFLLPDAPLAAKVMTDLVTAAATFSPLVEPAASGRLLLDTRGTEMLWGDARRVAGLLQERIRDGLHLPVAAGVAVCRPWSVLASRAAAEEDEPVCFVGSGEEEGFLNRVPIGWVDGLTPQTRTRLLELNIGMVGQLRQFGREDLLRRFGPCGDTLWEVVRPSAWQGVSRADAAVAGDAVRLEAVLGESTVAEERLRVAARALAVDAAATLRAKGMGAARLVLTLLHVDGVIKTAEGRTGGYIQDESVLAGVAGTLLGKVFRRRVRVTRLWLSAERLAAPERQGSLFAPAAPAAGGDGLALAMDGIRRRYGVGAVQPAALLGGTPVRLLPGA